MASQLQKWLDHGIPDGCLLILSGSSTRMQLLLDTSVLVRDLPFGESVRSAKKTRYRIQAGFGSRVPSGTGRGASNSTWSRRTRTTRRASW